MGPKEWKCTSNHPYNCVLVEAKRKLLIWIEDEDIDIIIENDTEVYPLKAQIKYCVTVNTISLYRKGQCIHLRFFNYIQFSKWHAHLIEYVNNQYPEYKIPPELLRILTLKRIPLAKAIKSRQEQDIPGGVCSKYNWDEDSVTLNIFECKCCTLKYSFLLNVSRMERGEDYPYPIDEIPDEPSPKVEESGCRTFLYCVIYLIVIIGVIAWAQSLDFQNSIDNDPMAMMHLGILDGRSNPPTTVGSNSVVKTTFLGMISSKDEDLAGTLDKQKLQTIHFEGKRDTAAIKAPPMEAELEGEREKAAEKEARLLEDQREDLEKAAAKEASLLRAELEGERKKAAEREARLLEDQRKELEKAAAKEASLLKAELAGERKRRPSGRLVCWRISGRSWRRLRLRRRRC